MNVTLEVFLLFLTLNFIANIKIGQIQSSIEKVDDKIATNREENDRKYSLLTSTIFKLEDSIGSKFSQLESNLRNELCENLKTFTDWEKVMSTNVTDIRKTISGK